MIQLMSRSGCSIRFLDLFWIATFYCFRFIRLIDTGYDPKRDGDFRSEYSIAVTDYGEQIDCSIDRENVSPISGDEKVILADGKVIVANESWF